MHDVRYAFRRLVRERSFSIVAIATLALGVAVVTASFAVIDAVLLRPIVEDQDRVIRVWRNDAVRDDMRDPFSYPEFKAIRDAVKHFTALAAVQYANANAVAVTLNDGPAAVMVTPVSPDFLPLVTSRPPVQGRWLQADDDRRGGDLAAVVSARLWRRVAAADPAFVGQRLRMHDGRHMVVVGIAPDEVNYPIGTEVWVPIANYFDGVSGRFDAGPDLVHFELVGRLAPGVSHEQARAELQSVQHQVAALFPGQLTPMTVVAEPVLDDLVGHGGRALWFLLAGAALVLVVAGVNVAALLLMRGARHHREQAVRLALGATRARLVRETATDSVILGAVATMAGIALAFVLLQLLRWIEPGGMPRVEEAVLDVRIVVAAAATVFLWVATLGTAPAWAHRTLDPARAGDLSSRGQPRTVGLRLFSVAQIATAVVVAIVAGLLVRSFAHLQAIDRGFDTANLAVIPLLLPEDRYADAPSRLMLYRDFVNRLEALPGVVSATPVHTGPGTANGGLSATMMFEGQTADDAKRNPWATFDPVAPSHFRTLGIPIRQGRAFTEADRADSERVAIVSESVVRRYWPGQNPIGKHVRLDKDSPSATVVGVAGETQYRELTKTWLTVYFPAEQSFYFRPNFLAVRAASTAVAIVPSVRAALRDRESATTIHNVTTMDTMLASEVAQQRTTFAVMLLFAGMALFLAAVGVYGVLAYDVSHRQHELAVRSALGASPRRLFRSVLDRSLGLAAAGVVIGLVVASVLTGSLESLLFEVSPSDPGTFAIAAGLLVTMACLAAIAPGRRAARSSPAEVLRGE